MKKIFFCALLVIGICANAQYSSNTDIAEKNNYPHSTIDSSVNFSVKNKNSCFVLADIGLLVGTVDNEMKSPLSFLTVFSYPVYKSLYVGFGSGFEFYQMTYVPFVGDLHIKPAETGLSFFLQGGYAVPLNKTARMQQGEFKFKPGILFNPGISYTFPTDHKAAFTISVAYRYQKNESEHIYDPNQYFYYQEYEIINRMNRFNLRVGYTFK
jgi:hypothetical protein